MKKQPPAPFPTPPPDRARLRWLLEWLRLDVAALKPGELLDLRNGVFTELHEPTLATLLPDDPDLRALRPARAEATDPVVVLARELLARVQRELRAGVAALEQTGHWAPFGLTPNRGAPQWVLEKRADGTVVRAYHGGWQTITVATAADLLAQSWPALRRCAYPPCAVLFLPDEGRQVPRSGVRGAGALASVRPETESPT